MSDKVSDDELFWMLHKSEEADYEEGAHYRNPQPVSNTTKALRELKAAREVLTQVMPLIKAIAAWENKNGTAAAIVGEGECREIATIVEQWARKHAARTIAGISEGVTLKQPTAASAENG